MMWFMIGHGGAYSCPISWKNWVSINNPMDPTAKFLSCLPEDARVRIQSLLTPLMVQEFLDEIPYRPEDDNYCPVSVFRDGRAHCFDGGLLAAAALRLQGYAPVIVQMIPENDDDHILAIFKKNGGVGAVGKSNFVGLRHREPVYNSIRELIMSYFDGFYNVNGERTLRGYSAPLSLAKFDSIDWMCSDQGAQSVAEKLHHLRHFPVLSAQMLADLTRVDSLTYRSGLLVVNPNGLYKPK
jgi:hypothetical protein